MPETAGTGDRTLCFAGFYCPPNASDPDRYLDSVPILRELPRLLSERGYAVHVVHHFPTEHRFSRDRVQYHFQPSSPLVAGVAGVLARLTGKSAASFRAAAGAVNTIRSLRPDVLHVHGTSLHVNHALLHAALSSRRPAVVLQYHGGFPSPHRFARHLQRYNFSRAQRHLFTTRSHARPFVEAGLIDDPQRVVEFMETSSTFAPMHRKRARRLTGMDGDPVFVWTARLHPIKDPLTALRGFDAVRARRPDAHLYMHYLSEEMLPDLQAFLRRRPRLKPHVHFRGRFPPGRMEVVYNSADFLLQASRREFSGCAVLEAMACGVIPVVTDIPSFRAMTDDGRFGVLFPPGKEDVLAEAVLSISNEQIPVLAELVRSRFETALSFPALADRLDNLYREVLAEGRAP